MSSIKAQIFANFVDRLKTIKESNGYSFTVQKVFADDIPTGLSLEAYELPAILALEAQDKIKMQHQCLDGMWTIELQLIHGDVSDTVMMEFVRDVFKAIYANSPVAERNDAFREIHPSIYQISPLSISPDLNMIEANRFYGISLAIHYRARLYNL